MQLFTKIVNDLYPLIIFAETSILYIFAELWINFNTQCKRLGWTVIEKRDNQFSLLSDLRILKECSLIIVSTRVV